MKGTPLLQHSRFHDNRSNLVIVVQFFPNLEVEIFVYLSVTQSNLGSMNDLQDNKILYLPMKFAVFTYIRSAYVSDLRKNESKRWLVETRSRDSPHPFTNDLFRHFLFGFVTFTFLTFFFK